MGEDLSGIYAGGFEEVAESVRQEARDETQELLSELDVLLGEVRHDPDRIDDFAAKARHASLIFKKQAGTVGLRLIGTIAHRMENYLSSVRELPPRAVDDMQIYIDKLSDVLEGRIDMNADASSLVRSLPSRVSFSEDDIVVQNIEVMLVMLHGTASHYVERELKQCGYRVTVVTTVFEAFPLVVRTKPDFIIISAIMPELYGIDLAVGLSAMPSTRNIPLALITSLDADDEQLQFLPQSIPIIRKGASFGDDLFKALDDLFLI